MKLHYHPLSSYSRKAAIGITFRGDPVELVVLNPFAGDLKTPEFLAASPFGKMPVLTGTPEGPIYESTSIIEYLEERGPRKLIPIGYQRRARHFDRLGDLYLLSPIGDFFWNKTPEVREKTEKIMARAWAVFERELADGRDFICGSDVTLADLSAAVAAHYAETEGVAVPPSIAAYRARLEAHPAFAASRDAAMPFVESTRPMRGG
jgi:glutathione S-transferase